MGKPGGHLHVDVAVVPHCQPDSVNSFLSQNEISVDNLFGKNVIGKLQITDGSETAINTAASSGLSFLACAGGNL